MTSQRSAFTLVELMVAMGIAIGLFAIVAFAQANINKTVDKGRALTELYVQSSGIFERLKNDLTTMQPSCLVHLELDAIDDDEQPLGHRFVFMRAFSLESMARSRSGGGSYDDQGDFMHELLWVGWDFKPGQGWRRGESPRLNSKSGTELHVLGDNFMAQPAVTYGWDVRAELSKSSYVPSNLWGRGVVPMRFWRNFINQGDADDLSNTRPEAAVSPWFRGNKLAERDYRGVVPMHSSFKGDWGSSDPFLPFFGSRHYQLGTMGLLDSDDDGTIDAYAAELPPPNDVAGTPDGEPPFFSKNALHLFGVPNHPDDPFYPSHLHRIADNLELPTITIYREDGASVEAIAGSDRVYDAPGLKLAPERYLPMDAGLSSGDSDSVRLTALQARPRSVTVTYVLHNMPETPGRPVMEDPADPDFNSYDPDSINYLRYQFYNEVPPEHRNHDMFKLMIEKAGYTAIIVSQAFSVN